VPALLPIPEDDVVVVRPIADALIEAADGLSKLKNCLGDVLRSAIDGVIKTPKTGRRFYTDLQNSEKTYIGTCVEIDLRAALQIKRGMVLDLNVGGTEVDVKFSATTSWMIPPQAVGHPCVLVSADDKNAQMSFGVIVARQSYLSGENRDSKCGIAAAGRRNIYWLFQDEPYAPNFWQTVSPRTAGLIADGTSGNLRMLTLFREVLDRPIPRKVVEDVARQKDFMRRLRADGGHGTRNTLAQEGTLVLSGVWRRDRQLIQRLGLQQIGRDEFLSHQLTPEEIPAARAAKYLV
jgi:hypothetical protein